MVSTVHTACAHVDVCVCVWPKSIARDSPPHRHGECITGGNPYPPSSRVFYFPGVYHQQITNTKTTTHTQKTDQKYSLNYIAFDQNHTTHCQLSHGYQCKCIALQERRLPHRRHLLDFVARLLCAARCRRCRAAASHAPLIFA